MSNRMRYFPEYSRRWLLARLPALLLLVMGLSITVTAYQLHKLSNAYQLNRAYDKGTLLKHPYQPTDDQLAYSIGYLRVKHHQPLEAIQAFEVAELSKDKTRSMYAKFALGNLYFEAAIASTNIEHGGSHRRAVERVIMAREAYKSVLRVSPHFYNARYNLELIDRLSPEKRTEGYENSPDGTIGLQPYQQNGTALMKDNNRRGLP